MVVSSLTFKGVFKLLIQHEFLSIRLKIMSIKKLLQSMLEIQMILASHLFPKIYCPYIHLVVVLLLTAHEYEIRDWILCQKYM